MASTPYGPRIDDPKVAPIWRGRRGELPERGKNRVYHSVMILDGRGYVVYDSGFVPSEERITFGGHLAVARRRKATVWYTIRRHVLGRKPAQVTTNLRVRRGGPPKGGSQPLRVDTSDASTAQIRKNSSLRLRRAQGNPNSGKPFDSSSKTTLRKNPETAFSNYMHYRWSSTTGVFWDTTVSGQTYNRTWSGVRTPNFAALQGQGRLPINGYDMSEWKAEIGLFVQTWKRRTEVFNMFETLIDPMSAVVGFPAAPTHLVGVSDVALRQLMERSGSGLAANLAQDIAQISQLTSMIGNTAIRLAKAGRHLRKGNIPEAVRTLWHHTNPKFRRHGGPSMRNSLANNWLELQYGWKPLLSDLQGSMKALAKFNIANVDIQHVTGSATKSSSSTSTSGVPNFSFSQGTVTNIETETRAKYGMRFKVASRLTSFLAQTGFTNPINLAWEVLPFSFVADWFLPIGTYLETLSAWDGLEFVDGYLSQLTKQRTFQTVSWSGRPTGTQGDEIETMQCGGSQTREYTVYSRVKLTAFPQARFPQLKNPISVSHAANGIALVQQVFGRRT